MSGLHLRFQVLSLVSTFMVLFLFALLSPPVLLLPSMLASTALSHVATALAIAATLNALTTWWQFRRLSDWQVAVEGPRNSLVDDKSSPEWVAQFAQLPRVLTIQNVLQTVGVTVVYFSLATKGIDIAVSLSIILLVAIVKTALALPTFVIGREFVSQVLAMLPWRLLERAQRGNKSPVSIRYRLLMAVTVAVAVVAVGASLSVDAQLRTNHLLHRKELAHSLSRLLAESGTDPALEAEIRQNGFNVRDEEPTGEPIEHPELPVVESITRPPLTLLSFLGPILFVIAVSSTIGFAIGDRIARDLSKASRDVDLLGTRDILRGGTRVAAPARFVEVVELGNAIEEVAGRFGEFAAGKERMIEAKESAQRMRDLFLASMSHDLRSPLNSVLGFVEILRKGALTAAQIESLDIIERRGRELLDLIGNILDAAKIEAGHLELNRDWIFPSEIVWTAVTRGRELAEEKLNAGGGFVQVQGELQSGIEPLFVDGPRVTQAVVNLVANAVKFMDSGVVRVRLTTDPQKQGIRIEVADQGRGIPEPEVAKIFDAFHQPIRSRRYGGLGLGLSLTRAFVALHSGTIEVNSSPEQGSVFTLSLPVVSPDQVPPSRKYLSEAPGFEEQTVKMPALDTTRG